MLPIIVTGKGLIPRTGMIAPVKKPFKVNMKTLETIIRTPKTTSSITAFFVNPNSGSHTELTITNYRKIYQDFQSDNNVSTITREEVIEEAKTEIPEEDSSTDEIKTEDVKVEESIIEEPVIEIIEEVKIEEPAVVEEIKDIDETVINEEVFDSEETVSEETPTDEVEAEKETQDESPEEERKTEMKPITSNYSNKGKNRRR